MKKPYSKPEMKVVEMEFETQLLAHSGLPGGKDWSWCEDHPNAHFCGDYESDN